MALEGKSPGKQAKKKGGGMDLDSLIAGANKIGEEVEDNDEEDLSDIDDEELLGELQVCVGRGGGGGGGRGELKEERREERKDRKPFFSTSLTNFSYCLILSLCNL